MNTEKNLDERYIKIANSLVEKSLCDLQEHRHELCGRQDRLRTLNRIKHIKTNLAALGKSFDRMVDVGCGDGSFMEELLGFGQSFVGFLPTDEECLAAQRILSAQKNISVIKGTTTELALEDSSTDFLLCNGVLLIPGFDLDKVRSSIVEFQRVLGSGGTLYVGEIPEDFEVSTRKYFKLILRNEGIGIFVTEIVDYIRCVFSGGRYTRLFPRNVFVMPYAEVVSLLEAAGFEVIKVVDSLTNEQVLPDSCEVKRRRLDYICRKL